MIDYGQFREYLSKRKLRSVSIESYHRDVEQFCDFIRQSRIPAMSEIGEKEICQYCDYMKNKGLAPVSVQRKIASIKRLFEYLCGIGQALANPAAGIRIQQHSTAKAKALTDPQLEKLLSLPDTRSVSGIRDRAMFMLIYATGIKVSELIALRIRDIQLDQKKMIIMRQGSTAAIRLSEETCRCLGAYIASRGIADSNTDDALFLNVYGKSITRQGVWKTLKKYADTAGLDGITLETIRRSFAFRYLNDGNDINGLREILGHSDISITRAYLKN